ncbi:MAG: hypothetical protein DBX47_01885 [Clostridiales bacterium]|nr:MAG: hypothetical protein DBX47_01885 [Clostridiales bacterium]
MYKLIADIFLTVLVISCITFLIMYLPRLYAWICSFKKPEHIVNEKQNKLAFLIPARNESSVIGDLFDSFEAQTYKNFDVFVLVKDENDKTVEMSKRINAKVYVMPNQTCKGDVLDFSLKHIIKEYPKIHDAFIIVDADCTLEKHFAEEMNNALASGRHIVTTKKIVKNYLSKNKNANSIWSCCNGLIWPLIDDLGNKYKSDKNIVNMTIGTGLMLRADVIKELGGWPYRETLTEDIELMYDCVLRDYTTYYSPFAKIYVEESTDHNMTNKRRKRWLTGVVDSKRLYMKRLYKKRKDRHSKQNFYFTTALLPVFSFVAFLCAYFFLTLFISVVLGLLKNPFALTFFWLSSLSFIILYISFFVMSLFCILADRKNINLPFYKKIIILFMHPFFYMEYIPIIFRAIAGSDNKDWEVIEREESLFKKG